MPSLRPAFLSPLVLGAAVFFSFSGSAVAATLPSRQPGLWQSTTNVTGADGQTLPNGSNIVSVSCVDPSTDLKFFLSKSNECSSITIGGGGSSYTIDSICSHAGKPIKIHETLVYPDTQNVTLNATYDAGGGPITISSTLVYQGDCLPGMAPGDEGSIEDGTFSKTDNINDSENQ